jgi:hypothetical protein
MSTKKVAAKKKAAPVKKALPAKKAVVAKKAAPAKKAVAAKKVTPPKKAIVKKAVSKKVAPKKNVSGKKLVARTGGGVGLAPPSRHIISKSLGTAMAEQFIMKKEGLKGIKFNDGIEFDRDLFDQILALPGCVKVRFYNALNTTNGEHTLVITAVGANKSDIYFSLTNSISTAARGKDTEDEIDNEGVGDMGDACPRYEPSVITLV